MESDFVKKEDWKTLDMPEKVASFVLNGEFTEEILSFIKRGHIPTAMEDKWFWYVQDGFLYIHRSWTGYCIYIVELNIGSSHKVLVNRNPKQYANTDLSYDIQILKELLHYRMTRGLYVIPE